MLHMSMVCGAVLATIASVASTASASDGGLVRIEPRAYYGAVVTIEHGVRVFRPLPAQQVMIINPNQTPINLSFNRSVEYRADVAGPAYGGSASDGGPAIYSGYGYGGYGFGTNLHRPHKHRLHGEPVGPRHHKRRPRPPHH